MPSFLYGTAWKELETERLTRLALEAGFRGIDTANQRRHYHEAGVGAAVRAAIADGLVTRDELFIQTKFTSVGGQDHRLPYDPGADDATQVRQSFASSLEHLGVERIDSYVLHGPSSRIGLDASDLAVWAAMEALHAAGKTRFIGVSNVALDQLELLCDAREHAAGLRAEPLLRAERLGRRDPRLLPRARHRLPGLLAAHREHRAPAHARVRADRQRAWGGRRRRWSSASRSRSGMQPLTGTTDPAHMREDLGMYDFELSAEDVRLVEDIAGA